MKELTLFFILFTIISSCSTFKSSVSIPANQSFILGELNDKDYSVKLTNKSNVPVNIRIMDKMTEIPSQDSILVSKERLKLSVSQNELLLFQNNTEEEIIMNVILSKRVEGMRYVDNE